MSISMRDGTPRLYVPSVVRRLAFDGASPQGGDYGATSRSIRSVRPANIRYFCYLCRYLSNAVRASQREFTWPTSPHPLYDTWHAMIRRCHDPRHIAFTAMVRAALRFVRHGDRASGASSLICRRSQQPRTRLRGTETDKGYAPGNVCWATPAEQARNRCDNPKSGS